MPPEITRLTTQFLKDPVRIEASRPATTADTISQFVARIPSADPKAKRAALRALVERADVKNGIVFCNRKSEVDVVAKSLKKHGFDAAPIHGDLEQSVRMRTLADFRSGVLKLLVASDVAARGLDIPDVSHVFNFDVPHHADDYVHRIGRTGRAGKTGQAFMIVTPADARNYDKVLKLTKKEPAEVSLDVDWADVEQAGRRDAERRAERGERTGRSERGGRGRRGDRRESPRADAPRAAATATAEAPAVEAPAPAPERAARPAPERTAKPERAPRKPEQSDRKPRPETRNRNPESASTGAFGGDTPAFLLRPTPSGGKTE
jgi:superfamily II DNA/RNA helicase